MSFSIGRALDFFDGPSLSLRSAELRTLERIFVGEGGRNPLDAFM
jgi:hypothetical protein